MSPLMQPGQEPPNKGRSALHRLGRQVGLEKRIHPHGLRYTYAVELERAGVPVNQISKLLGHSSIAVTSGYLDHLSNDAAIEALEAVALPALDI